MGAARDGTGFDRDREHDDPVNRQVEIPGALCEAGPAGPSGRPPPAGRGQPDRPSARWSGGRQRPSPVGRRTRSRAPNLAVPSSHVQCAAAAPPGRVSAGAPIEAGHFVEMCADTAQTDQIPARWRPDGHPRERIRAKQVAVVLVQHIRPGARSVARLGFAGLRSPPARVGRCLTKPRRPRRPWSGWPGSRRWTVSWPAG